MAMSAPAGKYRSDPAPPLAPHLNGLIGKSGERRKIMLKGRLLAMTILFFAAIATMAPLAFFAGLERGRGGIGADAAELRQIGTVLKPSALSSKAYSGSEITCEGEQPDSRALTSIICDTGSTETAPPARPGIGAQRQSHALTRSVVAAIADIEKQPPGAPIGLAMAPDQDTRPSQNDDQETFTTLGFQGIGGIPGSLTPIALAGQGAPSPTPLPPPPSTGPPGGSTPPPDPTPPSDPPMTDPPITIVPLPAAISLFAGGLAIILAFARRKQRI